MLGTTWVLREQTEVFQEALGGGQPKKNRSVYIMLMIVVMMKMMVVMMVRTMLVMVMMMVVMVMTAKC